MGGATALSNTLPLDQVRLIFAALDDNRSVRAAAGMARCARRTASRYALMWRRTRESGAGVDLKSNVIAIRPSPPAIRGLSVAARARHCGVPELVTLLLEAIADGGLTDPILDGAAVKVSHRRTARA